jgi:hypothetical protein
LPAIPAEAADIRLEGHERALGGNGFALRTLDEEMLQRKPVLRSPIMEGSMHAGNDICILADAPKGFVALFGR